MYKLISLDCDGTLINSQKIITQKTIDAILCAKQKGIKVVIASARPFYRLKKYLTQLELLSDEQYTIAFNGGYVVDNLGRKVLVEKGFTKAEVLELVKIADSFSTKVFLYTCDGIYANRDDEKYREKNPDVCFSVAELDKLDFSKIIIYKIAFVNSPDETIRLRIKLPVYLNDKYEVSSSVPQFVEFVSKGITKSEALKAIGNVLKINADEMIAFGDHENDLSMFDYVGYSVAMGNADDFVKSKADFTTLSNDEDGVAYAINEILLK